MRRWVCVLWLLGAVLPLSGRASLEALRPVVDAGGVWHPVIPLDRSHPMLEPQCDVEVSLPRGWSWVVSPTVLGLDGQSPSLMWWVAIPADARAGEHEVTLHACDQTWVIAVEIRPVFALSWSPSNPISTPTDQPWSVDEAWVDEVTVTASGNVARQWAFEVSVPHGVLAELRPHRLMLEPGQSQRLQLSVGAESDWRPWPGQRILIVAEAREVTSGQVMGRRQWVLRTHLSLDSKSSEPNGLLRWQAQRSFGAGPERTAWRLAIRHHDSTHQATEWEASVGQGDGRGSRIRVSRPQGQLEWGVHRPQGPRLAWSGPIGRGLSMNWQTGHSSRLENLRMGFSIFNRGALSRRGVWFGQGGWRLDRITQRGVGNPLDSFSGWVGSHESPRGRATQWRYELAVLDRSWAFRGERLSRSSTGRWWSASVHGAQADYPLFDHRHRTIRWMVGQHHPRWGDVMTQVEWYATARGRMSRRWGVRWSGRLKAFYDSRVGLGWDHQSVSPGSSRHRMRLSWSGQSAQSQWQLGWQHRGHWAQWSRDWWQGRIGGFYRSSRQASRVEQRSWGFSYERRHPHPWMVQWSWQRSGPWLTPSTPLSNEDFSLSRAHSHRARLQWSWQWPLAHRWSVSVDQRADGEGREWWIHHHWQTPWSRPRVDRPTAVVTGRVGIQEHDGVTGLAGVSLVLNGAYRQTDEQGRYRFDGVAWGEHNLRLDPSTLPSQVMLGERSNQDIKVSAPGVIERDFWLHRPVRIRLRLLWDRHSPVPASKRRLHQPLQATCRACPVGHGVQILPLEVAGDVHDVDWMPGQWILETAGVSLPEHHHWAVKPIHTESVESAVMEWPIHIEYRPPQVEWQGD